MNTAELKAARLALCLSSREAAEHWLQTGRRHYQYIEQGARGMPDGLESAALESISIRNRYLGEILAKDGRVLPLYPVYSDFREQIGGSRLEWRLYQSACIEAYLQSTSVEVYLKKPRFQLKAHSARGYYEY